MKTPKPQFHKFIWMLFFIPFLMVSCEGPEGPSGPPGAAGQQGPAGQQGAVGPAGPAGSANVIVSQWIPVQWTVASNNTIRSQQISAPEITEAALNSAVILVYIRLSPSNNFIKLLPSPIYLGATVVYTIDLLVLEGSIEAFHAPSSSGSGGANTAFPEATIRYVVIPAPEGSGRMAFPGDFNNYEEVCEFYGIDS